LQNTRGNPGRHKVDTLVLTTDEMADDQAETAGVHVGDFSEVEDIDLWAGVRRVGLKHIAQSDGSESGIHVARGEWTLEPKYDRFRGRVVLALDGERGTFPNLSLNAGHSISLGFSPHICDRWASQMPCAIKEATIGAGTGTTLGLLPVVTEKAR